MEFRREPRNPLCPARPNVRVSESLRRLRPRAHERRVDRRLGKHFVEDEEYTFSATEF